MTAAIEIRKPTADELAEIIRLHHLWLIADAAGVRADLRYADLRYADLRYADLRYADLRYADLRYADLRSADLRSADLRSADLRSADLRSADLRYANLSDNTILSDGVVWKEYVEKLVPALCVAGGRTLDEVANQTTWNCHSWSNCPMHVAFGVEGTSGIPALYRAQANLFIQLFDKNLIPLARVNPATVVSTEAPACEVPQ